MAESYRFEDRQYIDPTVSRDEQLGFIDRLREIENKDLRKIATDTHNLGTDVPSNLGGLSGIGAPNSLGISGADTGSAGIWRNRYERPQVNALVSDLKATAQATALNTALNNMLNQYKNRYNQAARAAAKSGGGGGDDSPFNENQGDPYSKILNTGAVNGDLGSYMVKDKNGTIKSAIDVITKKDGTITGVNTGIFSYGAEGETGTSGAQYLQNLIDQGYTFWDSNNQQHIIDTGL
jgi:hypothetical protein